MQYKVVKGDTLSEVANRFRTSVKAIQKANPSIKNVDHIKVGMVLNIPTSDSQPSEKYEELGRAFERALSDISKLESVKDLLKLYW